MSDIALYNVLTKLGANQEEAEKAVADVVSSKDVATKADLERMGRHIIMWTCGFIVGYSLVLIGLAALIL